MSANLETIMVRDWYPAKLKKELNDWNTRAMESNAARTDSRLAIEKMRASILSGEVSGGDAYGLSAELKAQALSVESNAMALANERATFTDKLAAAHDAERAKRQAALVTREAELREGMKKLGIKSRWEPGVINETLHQFHMNIVECTSPPTCAVRPDLLDQIRANIKALL
ncbi:MAG TPA: hypothetical protein PKE55_00790 [Kiritimatiellia bacterium]|nr:hypothetical protein [Kiritimatiellia bacterium]